MKRILITGANSYIGTSFERYMKQYPDCQIDTIDMINDTWKKYNFSGYDTVFHVAGLAHADVGKVSKEMQAKYYKVNTELTIETAKKAKAEGVKQFIFMSSSIVYGDSANIGKNKDIHENTSISPTNFYGDSKVQAENGILPMNDENFKVVILRPPMIYGKGSKGNYPVLSRLALKLPVFPYVENRRSMLYIDNLAEFVRLIIKNNDSGIFHPQNDEYSNTTELVKMIAKVHNKKMIIIHGVGWVLKLLSKTTGLVNKAFGNLCYDRQISEYKENYCKFSLEKSIEWTESNEQDFISSKS